MLDSLSNMCSAVQAWLFQVAVQPLMFHVGLSIYIEDAFDGTDWFLIGIFELTVLFLILRPLEAIIPTHAFTDRRARWTDFLYTTIQRLGAFSIIVFFLSTPRSHRLMSSSI